MNRIAQLRLALSAIMEYIYDANALRQRHYLLPYLHAASDQILEVGMACMVTRLGTFPPRSDSPVQQTIAQLLVTYNTELLFACGRAWDEARDLICVCVHVLYNTYPDEGPQRLPVSLIELALDLHHVHLAAGHYHPDESVVICT